MYLSVLIFYLSKRQEYYLEFHVRFSTWTWSAWLFVCMWPYPYIESMLSIFFFGSLLTSCQPWRDTCVASLFWFSLIYAALFEGTKRYQRNDLYHSFWLISFFTGLVLCLHKAQNATCYCHLAGKNSPILWYSGCHIAIFWKAEFVI